MAFRFIETHPHQRLQLENLGEWERWDREEKKCAFFSPLLVSETFFLYLRQMEEKPKEKSCCACIRGVKEVRACSSRPSVAIALITTSWDGGRDNAAADVFVCRVLLRESHFTWFMDSSLRHKFLLSLYINYIELQRQWTTRTKRRKETRRRRGNLISQTERRWCLPMRWSAWNETLFCCV